MTAGRVEMAPRVGLEPTTLRLRYTPDLSIWPGLSHRPLINSEVGRRALSRLIGEIPHPLVSARSPLLTAYLFAGLRSGLPSLDCRKEGFPEFTRFFNPDYSGKLLILHEALGDNLHKRGCTCPALVSLSPNFECTLLTKHRSLSIPHHGGETQALPCIERNYKADICRLCSQ
jgi:hypothetical protein